jgi:hypothetical protein
MKIKLRPTPPEGITGAKIIKVEPNKEYLRVVYELENGSILSKRYDYHDERGIVALSILVRICLGDVEEFDPEDLIGCRVKLELKKEDKHGIVYTNVKKVLPYDDEDEDELEETDDDDELEDADEIDSDESDSEDDDIDNDDSDEESDDDDSFEQPVHQTRRRRNIWLR